MSIKGNHNNFGVSGACCLYKLFLNIPKVTGASFSKYSMKYSSYILKSFCSGYTDTTSFSNYFSNTDLPVLKIVPSKSH